MEHIKPEVVSVKLPLSDHLEEDISITCFNFADMLISLLSDSCLTGNLENLDVNERDPFAKYSTPGGLLSCINSGQWYKKAYQNCIKNLNTDFFYP